MDDQADPAASCIFCKIVQEEMPSTLIEEWESTICIMPLNPCAPGHVIYIPKKHVQNGHEHPETTANTIDCAMKNPHENMIGAMEKEQQPLPRKSDGTLDPDFDYNTQFSKGLNATQTIFHLHVHLVPRTLDDGLPIMWTGQPKGHYNTRGRPKNHTSCGKNCPWCIMKSWLRISGKTALHLGNRMRSFRAII